MTAHPYSEHTLTLCEEVLSRNITDDGFTAGDSHFNDVWARDALYACWGVLETHQSWVKHTLSTLQDHMRDGQVPLRVGRQNMINVFLGLPTSHGPVYTNDKNNDIALDPNTLYIITAAKLVEKTPSLQEQYEDSVTNALEWLNRHETNQLLREGRYASWDDALKKQGASIYNNALYVAALRHASQAFEVDCADEARRVENRLVSVLWKETCFNAWRGREVCDVAGNLLAVYFNVGTRSQHESILSYLEEKQGLRDDTFLKTNYPSYHVTDTYLPFYLLGMHDYHDRGPYWTWITALEHLARSRVNENKSDVSNAERLDEWIQSNEVIPEVLDEDLSPMKRFAYESETGFSWTAGLILAAYH